MKETNCKKYMIDPRAIPLKSIERYQLAFDIPESGESYFTYDVVEKSLSTKDAVEMVRLNGNSVKINGNEHGALKEIWYNDETGTLQKSNLYDRGHIDLTVMDNSKVKDVTVNNESVVSEDGIAKIEIDSTKIIDGKSEIYADRTCIYLDETFDPRFIGACKTFIGTGEHEWAPKDVEYIFNHETKRWENVEGHYGVYNFDTKKFECYSVDGHHIVTIPEIGEIEITTDKLEDYFVGSEEKITQYREGKLALEGESPVPVDAPVIDVKIGEESIVEEKIATIPTATPEIFGVIKDAPIDAEQYVRKNGEWTKLENVDENVFIAEYHDDEHEVRTSYEDIKTAFNAGKQIFLKVNDRYYIPLVWFESSVHAIFQGGDGLNSVRLSVDIADHWEKLPVELAGEKVKVESDNRKISINSEDGILLQNDIASYIKLGKDADDNETIIFQVEHPSAEHPELRTGVTIEDLLNGGDSNVVLVNYKTASFEEVKAAIETQKVVFAVYPWDEDVPKYGIPFSHTYIDDHNVEYIIFQGTADGKFVRLSIDDISSNWNYEGGNLMNRDQGVKITGAANWKMDVGINEKTFIGADEKSSIELNDNNIIFTVNDEHYPDLQTGVSIKDLIGGTDSKVWTATYNETDFNDIIEKIDEGKIVFVEYIIEGDTKKYYLPVASITEAFLEFRGNAGGMYISAIAEYVDDTTTTWATTTGQLVNINDGLALNGNWWEVRLGEADQMYLGHTDNSSIVLSEDDIKFKVNSSSHPELAAGVSIEDLLGGEGGVFIAGTGTNSAVLKVDDEDKQNIAEAIYSVAIGANCKAKAEGSMATGYGTVTNGVYSHAEGVGTTTICPEHPVVGWNDGHAAHVEGNQTLASGSASHAEGNNTVANNPSEHAEGQYNISHSPDDPAIVLYGDAASTQHSIGIGVGDLTMVARKNAVEVMQNGDLYVLGIGGYDGKHIKDEDPDIEVKPVQELWLETEEVVARALTDLDVRIHNLEESSGGSITLTNEGQILDESEPASATIEYPSVSAALQAIVHIMAEVFTR